MPIHLHLTRTTLRGRQVLAVLESSAPASTAPVPDVATAAQCAVGSYRMADGSSVDIGPEAMAEQLPWRLPDGRRRWPLPRLPLAACYGAARIETWPRSTPP